MNHCAGTGAGLALLVIGSFKSPAADPAALRFVVSAEHYYEEINSCQLPSLCSVLL